MNNNNTKTPATTPAATTPATTPANTTTPATTPVTTPVTTTPPKGRVVGSMKVGVDNSHIKFKSLADLRRDFGDNWV